MHPRCVNVQSAKQIHLESGTTMIFKHSFISNTSIYFCLYLLITSPIYLISITHLFSIPSYLSGCLMGFGCSKIFYQFRKIMLYMYI